MTVNGKPLYTFAEDSPGKAGKDSKAQKLATGFASFMGPASHGAVQQLTLSAKPGIYVLACFMDTQDHREHVQLGMLKTIRIAK